jgi:hypothetical protein
MRAIIPASNRARSTRIKTSLTIVHGACYQQSQPSGLLQVAVSEVDNISNELFGFAALKYTSEACATVLLGVPTHIISYIDIDHLSRV